jgi:O-antigen/teichoic acid export membrane protein
MIRKALRWNFIFQYGYVITNMINAFILLPFYLQYINQVDLGLWWATGNILAWLTLADPGIGDVLQQKIGVLFGKKEYQQISKTIGSGLISSIIIFIVAIIVGLIFYFMLEFLLDINLSRFEELNNAFLISVLSTGITLVTFALAGINQGLLKSKQVAISYITSNLIYFVINLVFLILGWGLMAIAIANVIRAFYLVAYNLIVIFYSKSELARIVILDLNHFKGFVRIFSFTALSRVVSAFSNNIDLIILPRFIAPQFITIFEVNRRPIKMLQGLVGRYSVALMPGISNSSGQDLNGTKIYILNQLKFFLKITVAISCLSILCYEQLISLWIGGSQFAGLYTTVLLVLTFFFGLISYFISNVLYALGDIKYNSLINISKGIVLLTFIPLGAYLNGILGVLFTTLVTTVLIDFVFFLHRAHKLGIIELKKNIIFSWLKVTLLGVLCMYLVYILVDGNFKENLFYNLIINCILFSAFFLGGLLFIDRDFKKYIFKD